MTTCPRSSLRLAAVVLLFALLGGCATTTTNPRDPLEPFNRGVYQFNETLDKYVLKPVAQGYQFVLPQPIRTSVGNFFSNINDVTVMINNILQGKFLHALDDFGRVAINTSIGLLGFLDIASEAGLPKHEEDFGQTLGLWGLGEGPFIMLPFFGPSTGRDAVGRVGDYFTDILTYVDPTRARNQLWGTRVVDTRAQLLDASKVLEAAALDPYEFLRDAYLQRRRNLIYDGRPPVDKDLDIVPPKDRKGDADPHERTVAAVPPAEALLAASEDHMLETRARAPDLSPLFSEGPGGDKAPAPEKLSIARSEVSMDPGRQNLHAEAQAAARAPVEREQGSSMLMRVWRYIESREPPDRTLEGL